MIPKPAIVLPENILYCEMCGEPVYTVDDYPLGWEHEPVDAYECSDRKEFDEPSYDGNWCNHKSFHALTLTERNLKFGDRSLKIEITNREELQKALDGCGVVGEVAALWNYIIYLETKLGVQNDN